jgi:hypothetical protein
VRYLTRIALEIDILANVLLGGDTGQTISARAGDWAIRQDRGTRRRIGGALCGLLELADPGHCAEARANWQNHRAPRRARHWPYEGKIGAHPPA